MWDAKGGYTHREEKKKGRVSGTKRLAGVLHERARGSAGTGGGSSSKPPRRRSGALNDAMLSARFKLNSLGATDDAIESARDSCAPPAAG